MMMGAPFHTNGADQSSPPQREGRQHDANNTSPRKGDKAGGDNPPPAFLPKSFFPLSRGSGSYKETFTDI